MKLRRFAAALFAAFMISIMVFPVIAFASAGLQGASATDFGSSILDLLPANNSLGISLNKYEYRDLIYPEVRFPTSYEKAVTWRFPYSDEFFDQPVNAYSQVMAQGTLGLSVAAFRSDEINHNDYSNLESYFTSIGFGNISAEPFRHTPTANSVTYAIASKELPSQTIIAAICCGAGYGAEWSSNMTVGSGSRHQGFDEAAKTVEAALDEYIESNSITGKVTLWMGGYSRAAAIANLVCADMTDYGPFNKVYCYSFATPATNRLNGDYSNIFNIIGKNDPVPAIPFVDWGYIRNGIDLYLPTMQMDSDFSKKTAKLDEILNELDGNDFLYNPEFCSEFRLFFDYLLSLIPECTDYCSDLQPGVLNALSNSNGGNILSLVSRIVTTFSPDTPQKAEDVNDLIEYVEQLANRYVLRGSMDQIKAGWWNPSLNVTQNLTIEHDPDRYVAWMFSSEDPEEIFSQNITFREFTIKGNVKLHFYDINGYMGTIKPDGSISFVDPDGYPLDEDAYMPDFYIQSGNGQLNVTIPCDKDYIVSIESASKQTVTYYASTHSLNTLRSAMSKMYSLNTTPGSFHLLYFGTDTGVWADDINSNAAVTDVWAGSNLYSPGVIMKLQNINFLHLTLAQIAIFGGILILFTYSELIVCATLGFVRIFQGYQRRSLPTIVMHCLNAAVFLAIEVVMWYFVPAYPLAKFIAKLISFVFIISLSFVALTEHFSKRNLFLNLGILIFMILSVFFEDTIIPSVSFLSVSIKVAFYIMLAVAAALTWIGHTRRRAFKAADAEKKRYEKKIAKAEKDMQKAYDRSEKATQKYLAKQAKQAKK